MKIFSTDATDANETKAVPSRNFVRNEAFSKKRVALFAGIFLSSILGCQKNPSSEVSGVLRTTEQVSSPLRPLTTRETLEDFHTLVSFLRNNYGPLEYKEKRFGFNFEELANKYETKIAVSTSESQSFAYFMEFLAHFKDGHTKLTTPLNSTGIQLYALPLIVTPVEKQVVVLKVLDPQLKEVEAGDTVEMFDGKKPWQYLPSLIKYQMAPTPGYAQHLIGSLFQRPFFMLDLIPQSPTAVLEVKKPDGRSVNVTLNWKQIKDKSVLSSPGATENLSRGTLMAYSMYSPEMNRELVGSRYELGSPQPYFMTPAALEHLKLKRVVPSEAARAQWQLKPSDKPEIFAGLYEYQGKKILFVRNSVYMPQQAPVPVLMAYYSALFEEYQSQADVLILDQTHNPGGSYCNQFLRLFGRQEIKTCHFSVRADRAWIQIFRELSSQAEESRQSEAAQTYSRFSTLVEDAYDHRRLSGPWIPVLELTSKVTPFPFSWRKPLLVLEDELSGSCAEIFGQTVKANGMAKIFGNITAGLGGNVENVGSLPNSRMSLNLTRSLFKSGNEIPTDIQKELVENNGVTPDYHYEPTLADHRKGYIDYVSEMSKRALEQIQ